MDLQKYIRIIEDFPTVWISFKDITPLLESPEALKYTIEEMTKKIWKVDKIVALESRWFIFWSIVAYNLWIPLINARKIWKLPHDTIHMDYRLDYWIGSMEIHKYSINEWERVAIIDDLLATWHTAEVSAKLVEKLWWIVDSINFVINLKFLNWKERLEWYKINSLLDLEY